MIGEIVLSLLAKGMSLWSHVWRITWLLRKQALSSSVDLVRLCQFVEWSHVWCLMTRKMDRGPSYHNRKGSISRKLKSGENRGSSYSPGGVPWLWRIPLQEARSLLQLSTLSNRQGNANVTGFLCDKWCDTDTDFVHFSVMDAETSGHLLFVVE